jgi:hypothetical protein
VQCCPVHRPNLRGYHILHRLSCLLLVHLCCLTSLKNDEFLVTVFSPRVAVTIEPLQLSTLQGLF